MKNYIDHVRFAIIKISSLHNNSMNNLIQEKNNLRTED